VLYNLAELVNLIDEHHGRGHHARDRILGVISIIYKYDGMADIVSEYIKKCQTCQAFASRPPPAYSAWFTYTPLELVMFDIFFFKMTTADEYTCVLLVKDHFSKMTWGTCLRSKDAKPVTSFLLELFQKVPVPEQWHCDNGSEFVNKCMDEVMTELKVKQATRGKPRHPQTQGLIERA
jgi:hypothetical protein